MPLWLLNIPGLLGKVPREVWYVLAVFAAWWLVSAHYIDQGREQVLTELRKQEAKVERQAAIARTEADENANERADEFEHEQEVLSDAIEQAESTGDNALDGLFDGLSG